MSTTEVISQSIGAGQTAYFGQGRILYVKSASGPVTARAKRSGIGATAVRNFVNIGAGFKVKAEIGDGWDSLEIYSASAQNIEIIMGDDDVDVSNAVSVTGSVSSIEVPASAISLANFVTVAATSSFDQPANLTRKRITFVNAPTSADIVYIRDTGGIGNAGIQLQPGTSYTLANTGAIRIRNNAATPADIGILEES